MGRKISIMENNENKFLVYEVDKNNKNSLSLNHAIKKGQHHLVETFVEEKDNISALYNITDLVPVMESIPAYPGRDDVFTLIKKMIYVMEELREEFLCEPDLLLNKEYIYYDKEEKVLKFIATPEVMDSENTFSNLVVDIIGNANWKHNEKKNYLDELKNILNRNDVTSKKILDVINREMEKPVEYSNDEQKNSEYVIKDISQDFMKHENVEEQETKNPEMKMPEPPKPPKPPVALGPNANSSPYEHEEYGETSVLSAAGETSVLSGAGETTVLSQSQLMQATAVLVRKKNEERVVINQSEFWIGKDPMSVNYCIFDNSAISRKHAKIICRNNRFFIIDNHSTNHVYINGIMIEPNREVELFNDANIRLSDEDFRFTL